MKLNYTMKIGFTSTGKCVLRVMISCMQSNNIYICMFLLEQQMCVSFTDSKLGRSFMDWGGGAEAVEKFQGGFIFLKRNYSAVVAIDCCIDLLY